MKIAQVAPLWESVPPQLYGGTERIVSYLTEELVRQGHDVTLFASGDSVTGARLVAPCKHALRLKEKQILDPLACFALMLEQLRQQADSFDVIHFHIDHLHYSLCRYLNVPYVTTLHGRLDFPELAPLFHEFSDTPVISISDAQRRPLPWLNWEATVYHGIPENLYVPTTEPGRYLAFLGRITPDKGIERAIKIARRAGIPLKIAAKVGSPDVTYFEQVIKPLLNDPLIEFLGEIGDDRKGEFLGGALALLFPICWPEPFGLVMIESMACGTPVIAFAQGSVPEVIDDGITGFIVNDIRDAVSAVHRADSLDRRLCRQVFERRFSAKQMADNHLKLYNRLIEAETFSLMGTSMKRAII